MRTTDNSALVERLERERLARIEAERIADETIRDLYDRQCEIQLLRAVAFAANEARSIHEAMGAAIDAVCRYAGWAMGHVFFVEDGDRLFSADLWHDEGGRFSGLRAVTDETTFRKGTGLPGQVLERAILVWIEDVTVLHGFPTARAVHRFGVRAAVGVPVLVGSEVRAVLEFFAEEPRPLDGHFVDILTQVGTLLGRVLEREQAKRELYEANHRLTRALVDLQEAQEQIVQQERLRALGQLASGIAHDFNNALHPIIGYAELLRDQPSVAAAPDATRYVQNVLTSACDAAAVVSRLREFYRTRDDDDEQVPLDLSGLAEQVVDLTRPRWYNEALAQGKRISVTAEVDAIPRIMGHEAQLREAMMNLVLNAVDAMPAGGTIALRTRAQDGRVLVEVCDTGIGMTEEVRRRCLEPFFTTKGNSGSGLGLGMVYGIVQRHAGLLDIKSAPGRGTTITLSFAATAVRHAAASDAASPVIPAALRILVVDDQAAARDSLKEVLEVDRHSVESVGTGAEALTRLRQRPFDLVITDRSMPEMSGDELARIIKESTSPLPVIMITGFGVLMASALERPFGVDVVLPKPLRRAALRQALATLAPAVSSAA